MPWPHTRRPGLPWRKCCGRQPLLDRGRADGYLQPVLQSTAGPPSTLHEQASPSRNGNPAHAGPLRRARLVLQPVDDHLHRPRLHQAGPGTTCRRDLGLTRRAVRLGLLGLRLAYALFEVPSGWLGDRLGPRKVLTRIVLCWSLFTALTGLRLAFACDSGYAAAAVLGAGVPLLFDSFVLLVLVRFLFGAGEAGAYPNIARAPRNWFPFAQRGLAQGLVWTFGRWGGAVAPLLIGAARLAGLRLARRVRRASALLGVVWVVGFCVWFRDTPREHPGVNEAELALIEQGGGEAAKPAAAVVAGRC